LSALNVASVNWNPNNRQVNSNNWNPQNQNDNFGRRDKYSENIKAYILIFLRPEALTPAATHTADVFQYTL
jgi:hypothetical protein